MIIKKIGIAVCFVTMIMQAHAQQFNLELDGGLQGTMYSLQNGKSQQQPGGSLGVGYTYPLRPDLDFLTGVTAGVYRTKATLNDGAIFSSYQVDDLGSAFQYSVKTIGYKETQRFFTVSIPLMIQYHTPVNQQLEWYIDGGGKVFVPFGSNIQASAKQLVLSGYYPDYNIEVANLPQHGFGTIDNWKANTTTKLKPSAALSAATGISFNVLPNTRLYAGIYIDYGLTGLKGKSDSMPLATYSSNGVTGVKAGSLLNQSKAGDVHLLSFGLQVRLSFATPGLRSNGHSQKTGTGEPERPTKGAITDEQYDILTSPVIFGFLDQTSLPETEKKHLDDVVDLLKQYPSIRISLTGHTCDSENEPEDKKAGAERARTVAQYLRNKGIESNRLDVSSTSVQDVTEPFNPLANYQNRKVAVEVKK
jgi:OOP family OmpA-OmpF porin